MIFQNSFAVLKFEFSVSI